MELSLQGQKIVKQEFVYHLMLETDGGYFIRIGGDLLLITGDGTQEFSPDTFTPDDPHPELAPLQALADQTITDSSIDTDGTLSLTFSNGNSLQVGPDGEYEAWDISGPKHSKIVCLPSGELAIWDADEE
jgi:hypothetical protein